MNIGIFTDTYYPQVSGVATSIKVLRNQLERAGHQVYIFTTTDPHVDKNIYERNIFRFTSIPFVSFTDRRIAVRGLFKAYQVAKDLGLDIVHTQTEFSMGMIGKFVAKQLKVPCIHTYHTMYEDYLHYIANGKLLKPYHV
ncbi:1,2-diacylglycerol 3-glucosyltransferase, partial [Lactiplantibacillus plantarum]